MENIIKTYATCKTDPGCKRQNNEDVCLADNKNQYYLVADGVGGNAAGEVASRIFLETVNDTLSASGISSLKDADTVIQQCFTSAHQKLLSHIRKNPDCKGMGCTAEVLAFQEESAIIGHVGDSRTYLHRQGGLKLLTEDHSFVFEQVKSGLIKPEDARTHPFRNLILRAVGIEEEVKADIVTCKARIGDIILLCTDGLTDMVEDNQINEILSGQGSLQGKVDKLVAQANDAGGKDNIAVVLVECR